MDHHFPRYTEFDPAVPVWCVTPKAGRIIHRFFDSSPFSPSGRYLGLTRLPYEDRLPVAGDEAEIVVVDLTTGEERVVATTRGWDSQLGAQVQWGADDSQLFFNDVDTQTWRPFGVCLDPVSGKSRRLDGTIYMVSPDGKHAAGPCLRRTARTQAGYGVIVPAEHIPANHGIPADDGLFVTNTATGESRLLISLREVVERAKPAFEAAEMPGADFYAFHVKWTRNGARLMLVVRWLPGGKRPFHSGVVTLNRDGSDPRIAVPWSIWGKGGHHPDWCPDGEHILMNLKPRDQGLEFIRVRYDGTGLEVLAPGIPGSGHPTLHPNGRHILTDEYPSGALGYKDGTVPIRLVDTKLSKETVLARIQALPPYKGPENELRVDPHPAWDRAFERIAFNACPGGTRRVYVADLRELVGASIA